LQERRNNAAKYDRLAKTLGFPCYEHEQIFQATRQQASLLQASISQSLMDLTAKRDTYIQQIVKLKESEEEHERELVSLKQRSSQLDSRDIVMRQQMA